jgi:hypothetical protein
MDGPHGTPCVSFMYTFLNVFFPCIKQLIIKNGLGLDGPHGAPCVSSMYMFFYVFFIYKTID